VGRGHRRHGGGSIFRDKIALRVTRLARGMARQASIGVKIAAKIIGGAQPAK
jgi:hypothetical protein